MKQFHVIMTNSHEWSDEQMDALFAEGFPAFITADVEVKKHIGRVRELFPRFDITLTDTDIPVATGWGVPISWAGGKFDLPPSFADGLHRSVELYDQAGVADTFVICGAVVHPSMKGSGLAEKLLRALCENAAGEGLPRVVAPVRPTRKHLYPLLSIDAYAGWFREDGLPWDPWLRLHMRTGGRIVGLAPTAQTMTGTVAQWQEWTGLELPVSGDYVIPQGMTPLHVDTASDLGWYVLSWVKRVSALRSGVAVR